MDKNSETHFCFFCNKEAHDEEWVGEKRLWWCGCDDGLAEMVEISKDIENTARERAEKDNFSRYK